MTQRFFLDPDYEYYNHGTTPLKLSTVMNNGLGCGASIAALALFVPLSFIMLWAGIQLFTDRFDQYGIPTEATLVNCSWQRGAPRQSSELYLSYTFIDHRNQEHFGTAKIFNGQNRCGEMMTGDPIQIRYMIDQPLFTKVVDDRFLPPVWFIGGVTIIAFIGFGFTSLMVFTALKSGLKAMAAHSAHERLSLEGVVIDGELVEANGEFIGKKREVYMVHVKYRAKLPDGKGIVRAQKNRRDDLRDQPLPSPGTPVAVLYAGDQYTVML